MQNITVPREASPSPSFRERQRVLKTHSMPIVPSVSQVLNASQQQPSPTATNPSRRTPPPTSRISPVTGKLASGPHSSTGVRDHSPERLNSPPPPLVHAHSQPILPQQFVSSMQQTQPNVLAHHPRPINRGQPPSFLSQYTSAEEKWQITEELMADFERAEQQGQLSGMSGVAYAGGAVSTLVHAQHNISTTARDPAVERVRATDRSSPKDSDNNAKRQITKDREPQNSRESPKTRERSQTTSSAVAPRVEQEVVSQERPDYRASPPYQTPLTTPNERSAGYSQYIPDSYQSASNPPNRKPVPTIVDSNTSRTSPPSHTIAPGQSPSTQTTNPRPPARSLPVQEEPEEDVVAHDDTNGDVEYREHRSPKHSPDIYVDAHSPRYDTHRAHRNGSHLSGEEGDATGLNEGLDGSGQQEKSGEDDDSGFTPRSPSTTLPERPRDSPYSGTNGAYGTSTSQFSHTVAADNEQKTVRAKHRSAHSDHMNMRSFDPTLFEQSTVGALRSPSHDSQEQQQPSQPSQTSPRNEQPPQQSHYGTNGYTNHSAAQNTFATPPPPAPIASPLETLFEDPTSSYLRSYYVQAGSRPRAPIPPTPQSNTAAPSPSPALSAIQGGHEPRQMGSPYPYPFTHIRRNAPLTVPTAPSSSFDQNNPALIREQLALQMQIYALNNGLAAPSDSTFSPSSTPFPGPGYNPWGLMYQMQRPGDASMSIRSSPSHEPIPMPSLPPIRGHGLRRRGDNGDLRAQNGSGARRRVKPPPRVESTQPRDTSPEPSSGEETAGEDQFVNQYVSNDTAWVDRADTAKGEAEEDEGEWVDENDDGEEDLLQMEYHPSYVSKLEKRKRRFDTRWDALVQAFQALDRETDTTMVLLASPSHTSKLHSITSRSIRRDTALLRSEPHTNLRVNFNRIASHRRTTRSRRFSLADHLSAAPSLSGDGSQSGGEREEDLRRALEAALGSLGALGTLYEQREVRWRDEMRRVADEREHVEFLLRQALGPGFLGGNGSNHAASS